MKMIIKIKDCDSEKLNELKNILENKQIKIINNNLKSKDKIEIVYDDKKIKLNEKFNFKVKLIRNKYYRQLLNLINSVNKIIINKENFITHLSSNMEECEIVSSRFKDLLKVALINYIGVYNFDNIFELTKEEMIELKKYIQINDSEYITRLLGRYISDKSKEEVIRVLEPKIYGSKLDKIKECKNFILICPEIIQEFCIEYFKEFKGCGIRDIFELYTIIFNKVVVHEIGHAVFDYIDDTHNESRANYFASLTFDGTVDKIIQKMTDIQGGTYKNPKLIDDSIKTITKNVYKIK